MNSTHGGESEKIAWSIARRIGMVVVLMAAFFLSAAITMYLLFRSGDTRVPNVVGKNEAEARAAAEQAGLSVRIQRRVDPQAPANTVIETRPGPNASVKKDSVLTLVVSSGQSRRQLAPSGGRLLAAFESPGRPRPPR